MSQQGSSRWRALRNGVLAAAVALSAAGAAQAQTVLTPYGMVQGYGVPLGPFSPYRPFTGRPVGRPYAPVPSLRVVPWTGLGYEVSFFNGQPYYSLNPIGVERLRYELSREEAARRGDAAAAQAVQEAGLQGRASLRLQIEPGSALVYVDGRPIGRADALARENAVLRLAPGKYQLEALALGYAPLKKELDVKAGQNLRIEATLDRSGETDDARPRRRSDEAQPREKQEKPKEGRGK